MSDHESLALGPVRPQKLYRFHSNASREIALVDCLNEYPDDDGLDGGRVARDVVLRGGVSVRDREDMYRLGKKQELKVGGRGITVEHC